MKVMTLQQRCTISQSEEMKFKTTSHWRMLNYSLVRKAGENYSHKRGIHEQVNEIWNEGGGVLILLLEHWLYDLHNCSSMVKMDGLTSKCRILKFLSWDCFFFSIMLFFYFFIWLNLLLVSFFKLVTKCTKLGLNNVKFRFNLLVFNYFV